MLNLKLLTEALGDLEEDQVRKCCRNLPRPIRLNRKHWKQWQPVRPEWQIIGKRFETAQYFVGDLPCR